MSEWVISESAVCVVWVMTVGGLQVISQLWVIDSLGSQVGNETYLCSKITFKVHCKTLAWNSAWSFADSYDTSTSDCWQLVIMILVWSTANRMDSTIITVAPRRQWSARQDNSAWTTLPGDDQHITRCIGFKVDSVIQLSDTVKILGATLDSSLTKGPHTKATSKSCFCHIR